MGREERRLIESPVAGIKEQWESVDGVSPIVKGLLGWGELHGLGNMLSFQKCLIYSPLSGISLG